MPVSSDPAIKALRSGRARLRQQPAIPGRPRRGPRLRPSTRRRRAQAGRGRTARGPGSSLADPQRHRSTRWPSSTRNCSLPEVHSGCGGRAEGEPAPTEERSRLEGLTRGAGQPQEKAASRDSPAVVVQDGGPKGTRHEGFKDAQVFLRGNPRRLGKTVPRGVPRSLAGRGPAPLRITEGSGRRRTGRMAGAPRQPPDGPRHGQPDLAASLRRGLWSARPTTSARGASGRRTPSCSTGWPRGSSNRVGR